MSIKLLISKFILLSCLFSLSCSGQDSTWQALDNGLMIGEFEPESGKKDDNVSVTILRIDPELFELQLFPASAGDGQQKTVKQWAQAHGLLAVVNAGMYQEDLKTSVGYLRSGNHINNSHFNRNMAVFVSGRKDSSLAHARIIDRECHNLDSLVQQYDYVLQSIRMINCSQENTWRPRDEKWSMVVLGMDKSGHILLIHSRTPYSVHNFINILLELPIDIYNAMYLEGGPEAGLYISHDRRRIERYGHFRNTWFLRNPKPRAMPIPNVLGVVKKDK